MDSVAGWQAWFLLLGSQPSPNKARASGSFIPESSNRRSASRKPSSLPFSRPSASFPDIKVRSTRTASQYRSVGFEFSRAEAGFTGQVQGIADFRRFGPQTVVQFGHFLGCIGLSRGGEEAQPSPAEAGFDVFSAELGQLNEDQLEPIDGPFRLLDVDHLIMVIKLRPSTVEDIIQDTQADDGLKQLKSLALFQLPDIRLARVEEDTLKKGAGPVHLHLHDELPAGLIAATDIDNAVFEKGDLRNLLCRQGTQDSRSDHPPAGAGEH